MRCTDKVHWSISSIVDVSVPGARFDPAAGGICASRVIGTRTAAR